MCHLQELYAKYKDKGLVILGCDPADDKKIALELLRENGVTFPNIIDNSEDAERITEKVYALSGWPSSYIIDRDGKVVDAWPGYDEGEPRAIAALQKTGGELAEAVRDDANAKVMKSADDVAAAARRLFDAIRAADYEHNWLGNTDWKYFPAKDVSYEPDRNRSGWVRWVCTKFKTNPIAEVQIGKVFANPNGRPTVHFELKLKDGEILQGDLPFTGNSDKKLWTGQGGLDWHLQKEPKE
jgi:hypothetical protein